jgi:hypothetical protein
VDENDEKQPTPSPLAQAIEEKTSKLEQDLALLQPGVQVLIERLQPGWCRGPLEKYTVGEEGLDLTYLRDTWGGDVLSIKIIGARGRFQGSHTIELKSFPPRSFGRKLRQPNRYEPDDGDDMNQPSTPAINPNQVSNQQADMMFRMVELLNNQRQSEVDTLRLLLEAQIKSSSERQSVNAGSGGGGGGGVSEILKMARGYHQLRDLFQSEVPSPQDPDEAFPMMMLETFGKFFNQPNSPTGPKAPITGARQLPATPKITAVPNTKPQSVPPATQVQDLSQTLSKLPPREAARTILNALGSMPEDQREAALEEFWGEFSQMMPDAEGYDDDQDQGTEEG